MDFIPESTYYIVIGSYTYDSAELNSLKSARKNANDISEAFEEQLGIPTENGITFLTNTKEGIKKHIIGLADPDTTEQRQPVETLILYYSGHGIVDAKRENYYLSLKETETSDFKIGDTSLSISSLNEIFNKTQWNIIMILDSCFSEMAFQQFNPRNFFVVASSAKNKTSKYPLNEEHSVFTDSLLHVLTNGIQTEKEILTWHDIFNEVKNQLAYNKHPIPHSTGRNEVADIPVLRNVGLQKFDITTIKKIYQSLKNVIPEEVKEFENEALTYEINKIPKKWEFILRQYPIYISYYLRLLLKKDAINEDMLMRFFDKSVIFLLNSIIIDISQNSSKGKNLFNKLLVLKSNHTELLIELLTQITKNEKLFFNELATLNNELVLIIQKANTYLKDKESSLTIKKEHLVNLISGLSFFGRYKYISTRIIRVKKRYVEPDYFIHQVSDLSGERYNTYKFILRFSNNYLNSSSVIVFNSSRVEKIKENDTYLNMWPLLIDANGANNIGNTPSLYNFSKIDNEHKFWYKNAIEINDSDKRYQDIDDDLTEDECTLFFKSFEKSLR